jgi:hypothetical protein
MDIMQNMRESSFDFDILPIHTLNARDNTQLDFARTMAPNDTVNMFAYIHYLRWQLEEALAFKGIKYADLRRVLEPSTDRLEIALVFDTKYTDCWYGREIFDKVIPLFDRNSKHSVLCGDYLHLNGLSKETLLEIMGDFIPSVRDNSVNYVNQYFIIYINNITETMVSRLNEKLQGYRPYLGMADMTYGSKFKFILSFMLPNIFIKHGGIIIQGCPNDYPEDIDFNIQGWPFEEHGYACRSISDNLVVPLLSYKIERPVYEPGDLDTIMSLNAIELMPSHIDDFEIELDAAKARYIRSHNASAAARSGINSINDQTLKNLIKSKIKGSYIYHLSYIKEHNVRKFNVIIELASPSDGRLVRMCASLEYKPWANSLRIITLY